MFSSGVVTDVVQHVKPVVDLKWNCDGSYLGSASYDKSVKLYSLDSSGVLKVVHTIACTVTPDSLCWHPTNPTRLAILTNEKNIEIWDVKATSPSSKLVSLGSNLNASWSPNGKYLAVGNKSDNVIILEIATGKLLKKFKFNYEVNEFAWTALSDYLLLATGAPDGGTVDILSFSTSSSASLLTLVDSLPAHTSSCFCLKLDPTGSFMAVGSADFLISLWDLREGCVCVRTITAFDSPIRCLGFSGSGEYLVAASDSNQLLICSVLTGELVSSIEMKTNVNCVSWNCYRNILATGHDNKALPASASDSRGGGAVGSSADSISGGGLGGGGGGDKTNVCTLVDSDRGPKKAPGAPALVKLINFELQ
jgi:THO complex subunit 3